MDGVQFKQTLQTVRERWPNWTVNATEIKDLGTVFMAEAKSDVDEAMFLVRKKYSSDVPRLPWFFAALDEIKGKRLAEVDKHAEQERMRKEMQDREFERMQCNKEHGERVAWLIKQPEEDVDKARDYCIKHGYIQAMSQCPIVDWPRFASGMVYSYMNR